MIRLVKPRSRILAIGAHPDDVEFSCLGSLLRLKKEHGCKLFSLVCTNGEIKGPDRITEHKRINRKMGTEKSFHLGLRDGCLAHNQINTFCA